MSSNCRNSAADPLHAVIAGCRAELAGLYAEVAADGAKKMRRWQDESPMLESYIQGGRWYFCLVSSNINELLKWQQQQQRKCCMAPVVSVGRAAGHSCSS
jgi:hypothetical protein